MNVSDREYIIRNENGRYYAFVKRTGEKCEISEEVAKAITGFDNAEKYREKVDRSTLIYIEDLAGDEDEDDDNIGTDKCAWLRYDDRVFDDVNDDRDQYAELLDYIWRAIPEKYHQLFLIMYGGEHNTRQISKRMGLSYNTTLYRIRSMKEIILKAIRKRWNVSPSLNCAKK